MLKSILERIIHLAVKGAIFDKEISVDEDFLKDIGNLKEFYELIQKETLIVVE